MAANTPQFLVKSVLNGKLKIFQLSSPTMEHLWDKIGAAYGMSSAVASSTLQGQYIDKDEEAIFVDTNEELMLAFAICEQPLRINLLLRGSADLPDATEPVAMPVRNDAVDATSSSSAETANFFGADGVLIATKVEKGDSSDDSSSSDLSDDNLSGRPETISISPPMLTEIEQNLHNAGVDVAGKDLQAFMQLLQIPISRLAHCFGNEKPEVQKKVAKVLAKAQRREMRLKAKYDKVQSKLQSKNRKPGKSSTVPGNMASIDDNNLLGEWAVEQTQPTKVAPADWFSRTSRGRGGHRLENLRRKLLWPLFWRNVLLEHGIDINTRFIRQLCFLLKIRKGKLFDRNLATRDDFHAFCQGSHSSAESYIASIPQASGGSLYSAKGKGIRKGKMNLVDGPQGPGRWKGKGRGHGWGYHGGGVHDELGYGHGEHDDQNVHGDELYNLDYHHMSWKGKGKGKRHHHPDHIWMGKGKGKVPPDMWLHHHSWMMEKGKGFPWGKGKGHGAESWWRGETPFAPRHAYAHINPNDESSDDISGGRRRGCSGGRGSGGIHGGRGSGGIHVWGEEVGEGGKCLARFVSHLTVPDGTVVESGAPFLKIWSVRNDGNQPWPADCELVVVGGDGGKGKGRRNEDDRGAAENPNGTSTKLVKGAAFGIPHKGIEPGHEVSIALDFRAPQEPGLYQVFFRLRDAGHGKKFGQRLWFSIMVKPARTPMDGLNPVRPIGSGLSKQPTF